jgi:hypothetical protein
MNLQELINKRLPLNNPQRDSLLYLLTRGCHSSMKAKLREALNNKFYTVFDGKHFCKNFTVRQDEIIFDGKVSMSKIRQELVNAVN